MMLQTLINLKIFGLVLFTILAEVRFSMCACAWPNVFQNSRWWDSGHGELKFTTNEVTGFTTMGYAGVSITTWLCMEETFASDGIVLIRSKSPFLALGLNWYAYVCMRFTAVTSVSFTYHLLYGQNPNAAQYRQFIHYQTAITAGKGCNSTTGASGAEFVTIIKKGNETAAFITCPSALQGKFEFNYTDSKGIERCNNPNRTEILDVCLNKSQLNFDIPCEEQSPVYASGNVYCVASANVGTDTFVQLFNNEPTVDNRITYRFSCMAISSDRLRATVVYSNCTNHQNSTYLPRNHNGTIIGASISFLPYKFCTSITSPSTNSNTTITTRNLPVTSINNLVNISASTSTSRSSSGLSTTVTLLDNKTVKITNAKRVTHGRNKTSVIVGVLVGITLAVVAIVLAFVVYYQRRKKMQMKGKRKTKQLEGLSNNEVLHLSEIQDDCLENVQSGLNMEHNAPSKYERGQDNAVSESKDLYDNAEDVNVNPTDSSQVEVDNTNTYENFSNYNDSVPSQHPEVSSLTRSLPKDEVNDSKTKLDL